VFFRFFSYSMTVHCLGQYSIGDFDVGRKTNSHTRPNP